MPLITAVDHVELFLRDAFFFQLAVGFFGEIREIGVLFLQRRDAVFAEREGCGSGRGFGWRQRFGFKLARRGRRRVAHVLKRRDHRAFVCLDHLQNFGAGMLCFLVALEVVDVFDRLRNVLSQVLLQRLFAFVWIHFRRGSIAELTTGHLPNVPSIAVLPFVNMSADAENEYFCDGLAEELLNALTRINNLKVAARTSAFSFKSSNKNVSEIGAALNVKTVLEGSVRKSGNRLRITAQLIKVADGYHLWSESYDREMKDVLDVQDEITLAIVEALRVKLLGDEKQAMLKRHTDDTEAYQLYLKGRYYWNKRTAEGFEKALECFEKAMAHESNHDVAYAAFDGAHTPQ